MVVDEATSAVTMWVPGGKAIDEGFDTGWEITALDDKKPVNTDEYEGLRTPIIVGVILLIAILIGGR